MKRNHIDVKKKIVIGPSSSSRSNGSIGQEEVAEKSLASVYFKVS
jgi:hypothetical protein